MLPRCDVMTVFLVIKIYVLSEKKNIEEKRKSIETKNIQFCRRYSGLSYQFEKLFFLEKNILWHRKAAPLWYGNLFKRTKNTFKNVKENTFKNVKFTETRNLFGLFKR